MVASDDDWTIEDCDRELIYLCQRIRHYQKRQEKVLMRMEELVKALECSSKKVEKNDKKEK